MFSITARIRYTASALTQNRLWHGLNTIERCSEIKGKFTEAVSNFSSLWDCCPLNDSSPQPFWFRGHYCPFLCQLQSDWSRHKALSWASVWIMSCLVGSEYLSTWALIKAFSGESVLSYAGVSIASSCLNSAVRLIVLWRPCCGNAHICTLLSSAFSPLWHNHMTNELDCIHFVLVLVSAEFQIHLLSCFHHFFLGSHHADVREMNEMTVMWCYDYLLPLKPNTFVKKIIIANFILQ